MRMLKLAKLNNINRHIIIGLKELSKYSASSYWTFGSVICAALNGSFYRRIGDIDILIDSKNFEHLRNFLLDQGYSIEEKKPWTIVAFSGFSWTNATKGKICISIVKAHFNPDGSCWLPLNFGFSGYLPASALTPTSYRFYNINFWGLPPESLLYRIKIEYGNNVIKHREKDLQILQQNINPLKLRQIERDRPGLKFMGVFLPVNPVIAPLLSAFNLQRR